MKSIRKFNLIILLIVLISSFDIYAKKPRTKSKDQFVTSLSTAVNSMFNGQPVALNSNITINSFKLSKKDTGYNLDLVYKFNNPDIYDDGYYRLTDDFSYGLISTIIKYLGFETSNYKKHNVNLNVKIVSSENKTLFSKVITPNDYINYYNTHKDNDFMTSTKIDMNYIKKLVDYLNKDVPIFVEDGVAIENIELEGKTVVYNISLRSDIALNMMNSLLIDMGGEYRDDIKDGLIQEKILMFKKQQALELQKLGITFRYKYRDKSTKREILTINISMDEIIEDMN